MGSYGHAVGPLLPRGVTMNEAPSREDDRDEEEVAMDSLNMRVRRVATSVKSGRGIQKRATRTALSPATEAICSGNKRPVPLSSSVPWSGRSATAATRNIRQGHSLSAVSGTLDEILAMDAPRERQRRPMGIKRDEHSQQTASQKRMTMEDFMASFEGHFVDLTMHANGAQVSDSVGASVGHGFGGAPS